MFVAVTQFGNTGVAVASKSAVQHAHEHTATPGSFRPPAAQNNAPCPVEHTVIVGGIRPQSLVYLAADE